MQEKQLVYKGFMKLYYTAKSTIMLEVQCDGRCDWDCKTNCISVFRNLVHTVNGEVM